MSEWKQAVVIGASGGIGQAMAIAVTFKDLAELVFVESHRC